VKDTVRRYGDVAVLAFIAFRVLVTCFLRVEISTPSWVAIGSNREIP